MEGGEEAGGQERDQAAITVPRGGSSAGGVSIPAGAVPVSCMPARGCPHSCCWLQGGTLGGSSPVPARSWPSCGVGAAGRTVPQFPPSGRAVRDAAGWGVSRQVSPACTGVRWLTPMFFLLLQMQSRAAAPGRASARTRRTANPSRWVSGACRARARGQGTPEPVPRVPAVEVAPSTGGHAPCAGGSHQLLRCPQPQPATAWCLQ